MSDAAVNGVSSDSIYLGFWTNWTYGYTRGATITLTKRDGGLLTAFLALFVTIVGRSFCRLFCLAAHTRFSASTAQDGLYHQRQAVLRNSDESIAGFKSLVQLSWSWRRKSPGLLRKMMPLISITAILVVGFYVASVFSAQISTAMADEVLISSPECGLVQGPPDTTVLYNVTMQYMSKLNTASASYAQQCYGTENKAQECSIFVKKQIPQIISRNVSCPFPGQDKICMRNSTNLRIDSGAIDSHNDFGINAAPKDRFTYRNVLECAPLHTQGYNKIDGGMDDSSNSSAFQLLYGSTNAKVHNDSITFQWPLHAADGIQDYMIRPVVYEPGDTFSKFVPIPEIIRDDAIVTLFFLTANGINFISPVDDELFAAHKPTSVRLSGVNEPATVYHFDEVAHVLGCTTQLQFCLSGNGCTPLTSWLPALHTARNMTITETQSDALNMFARSHEVLGTAIRNTVGVLGASALIGRNSYMAGTQGPIEPNQWQREAEHWQATTLTTMQRMVVEFATGPSDARMEDYLDRPANKSAKHLCESQKVRSASHSSFSVLGLCLIFILGGIIIISELAIKPLIDFIQRRRGNLGLYQRLEWDSTETLQLQRMAHEELGAGTWVKITGNVPTTEYSDRLAVLDVSDEKHPRLMYDFMKGNTQEKPTGAENEQHPSFTNLSPTVSLDACSPDTLVSPTGTFDTLKPDEKAIAS